MPGSRVIVRRPRRNQRRRRGSLQPAAGEAGLCSTLCVYLLTGSGLVLLGVGRHAPLLPGEVSEGGAESSASRCLPQRLHLQSIIGTQICSSQPGFFYFIAFFNFHHGKFQAFKKNRDHDFPCTPLLASTNTHIFTFLFHLYHSPKHTLSPLSISKQILGVISFHL